MARAKLSRIQAQKELVCDQLSVPSHAVGVYTLERQTICGGQRSTNLNHNIDIISPRLTLLFLLLFYVCLNCLSLTQEK